MERARVALDAYDEEPRHEFVKCVVVGDTCVGKTRLICSYVFNHPEVAVTSLYNRSHIPTVFAIDHYMTDATIRERAKLNINGVHVQLRIWDTFGDHEKNRRFAYQNAHVVMLCYSIGMPSSLRNVNAKWYPEIKKYCPRAPIILVATQLDRRHTNPAMFKSSVKVTTLSDVLYFGFRDVGLKGTPSEGVLVTPELGRQTAKEIGASSYMEVSVVTKHGVDQSFLNSVYAALSYRRHQRPLFTSHLKRIPQPQQQEPYLPEREETPIVCLPPERPLDSTFEGLFRGGNVAADTTFLVECDVLPGHRVLLASMSEVFERLLLHPNLVLSLDNKMDIASTHGVEVIKVEKFIMEEGYINGSLTQWLPRGFSSMDHVQGFDNASHIYVKVKNVSALNFRLILEYLYTGKIHLVDDPVDLLNAATYLQVESVVKYAANLVGKNFVMNLELEAELKHHTASKLYELFFRQHQYSDVLFQVDNELIPAHRPVLVARSDMMEAMFRNRNFRESGAARVDFNDTSLDSFLNMLEYLYTGKCRYLIQSDIHGTLQLANFLCLSRLVAMCELALVEQIESLEKENSNEVYHLVLASYSVGKVHNAPQLAAWCLHFMATNYNNLCRHLGKDVKLLDDTTQKYLEENRYPPVWYLKEADFYEKAMRQLGKDRDLKKRNRNRNKKCPNCF